jgi:RNA polymerase sigma factor (sigma-70 family)
MLPSNTTAGRRAAETAESPMTAPPGIAARDAAAAEDAAVLRLSTSDSDRFGAIFDRYYPEIRSYVARRLTAEAADDVAASAFLAAFRKRGTFDPEQGTVRAWLYGFATRELGAHRRTELRRYQALARLDAQARPAPSPDGAAEPLTTAAIDARLAAALGQLSTSDRDVLLLVALAGLSYAEVGQALSIPDGTVASRLNRARRQLRDALSVPVTDD